MIKEAAIVLVATVPVDCYVAARDVLGILSASRSRRRQIAASIPKACIGRGCHVLRAYLQLCAVEMWCERIEALGIV